MKLATRYSAAGILLLALAVVFGGYNLIQTDFNNRIGLQSHKLDQLAAKITASNDPLSSSLLAADEFGSPLSLSFMTSDGALTEMVQSSISIKEKPEASIFTAAKLHAKLIDQKPAYLLRVVEISGGDFVIIAEDVSLITLDRTQSLGNLGIMSLLLILFGGGLLALLVRIDMRSAIKTLKISADHERETRQAMQAFMGDASHELRTPLTVIKGYSEMLSGDQDLDKDARKKAFGRIVEQVDRMDETISSLLKLAEAGSVSANSFEAIGLSELVETAVDDLEAIDQGRPVEREVTPGITVNGSRELLTSLLNNAIGNVHRHTPASAAAYIRLHKTGKAAVLTIEDAGPGLPVDAYERGIRAFQRFDASRSRASGGSGLGMAIMNSIVEAHSGSMNLGRSDLGGLRIEITLPLN
ncbi:MAG: sensor histidine kinase [Micrococcales bacterium]